MDNINDFKNLTYNDLPAAVEYLLNQNREIKEMLLMLTGQNKAPTIEKELLDTNEAAKLLNKSSGTIYNMVSMGIIPYSKPGKRLMFLRAELLEWVASNKKKTIQELTQEAEIETIGAENTRLKSKRRINP